MTSFVEKARTKLEKVQKDLEVFRDDQRAEYAKMMTGGIIAIVAIVVIAILGSALLPGAVNTVIDTNTTTWSTGSVSIWDAIPIFIVLAFLLIVLAIALYVLKSLD